MSHAKPQSRKELSSLFAPLRLCVSLFILAVRCEAAGADPAVAATVVVFNEADVSSAELAGYYAEKRGIPFDHLIGISCTLEESVSRAEYESTIAEPLRKAFRLRGWWKTEADLANGRVDESKIRFVALMRGIPLKIAPVAAWPGDKPVTNPSQFNHNEAAVDSELALLGAATRQISGPLDNPCFKNPAGWQKAPWLLMVCRLDAADPATVRRMIDDSIATEKTGLWGFAYIDSRGIMSGAYHEGDAWMRGAASDATSHGIPCVQDTAPTLFPEHYPMSRAALYFGWYSGEVQGAFKEGTFRFLPGAVAVHLHSFSAESLRPPLRGWCAPLLERGAAATLGNVYEPFLSLTTHRDELEQRLRTGARFAEAAYAAQPVLSWMTTFVGDPLYRPFKAQPAVIPPRATAEYLAYRDGATLWAEKGRAMGEAVLQSKGRTLRSGMIYEGLGLLQIAAKDPAAALVSWRKARELYKDDADCIRCALHAIALLRETGRAGQALSITREEIGNFPNADATARLRAIENELAPPSPTPASSAHATR